MKKILLILLVILFPINTFAATKTLCASGCDYTTCAGWVSYLQGLAGGTGVLAAPEILEVHESVTSDCSITTGITTSASNYWEIKGWATCKHAGLYAAGKCELTGTNANQTVNVSAQGYWRITDMIISNTGAATGGNNRKGLFADALTTGEARIINTIFRHTNAGGDAGNSGCHIRMDAGSGTYKVVVANSIAHDWSARGFIFDVRDLDTLVFYNNTSHGNNEGLYVGATNGSTETCRLKNLILDTNTTADLTQDAACATQTLADILTSDATGTSGDTAKNPTYVNEAGDNFSLAAGDGVDVGTDLSADGDYAVTTDIIGTARPQNTTFDIGAWEKASGTSTTTTTTVPASNAFSTLNQMGEL